MSVHNIQVKVKINTSFPVNIHVFEVLDLLQNMASYSRWKAIITIIKGIELDTDLDPKHKQMIKAFLEIQLARFA